jgi:hypothetical protein
MGDLEQRIEAATTRLLAEAQAAGATDEKAVDDFTEHPGGTRG